MQNNKSTHCSYKFGKSFRKARQHDHDMAIKVAEQIKLKLKQNFYQKVSIFKN